MNNAPLLVVLFFSIAPVLGCGTTDPEPGDVDSPDPRALVRPAPGDPNQPTCIPDIDHPCEPDNGPGGPSGGGNAASSAGGDPPWGPDLVPVPTGNTYCVKASATQLVVNIANMGTVDSGANATRVEYFPGGIVDSYVPALAPGQVYQYIIPIPCHGAQCKFRIAADDSGSVVETNEFNNYVYNVWCP